MSATIIMFPALAPSDAGLEPTRVPTSLHHSKSGSVSTRFPPISATALATKFSDHYAPVVQVSIDLLEADERDFEARCRRMLDADSTVMIDELCGELQIVGEQMQILVDGIELTRTRLRTAMARLADDHRQETK